MHICIDAYVYIYVYICICAMGSNKYKIMYDNVSITQYFFSALPCFDCMVKTKHGVGVAKPSAGESKRSLQGCIIYIYGCHQQDLPHKNDDEVCIRKCTLFLV